MNMEPRKRGIEILDDHSVHKIPIIQMSSDDTFVPGQILPFKIYEAEIASILMDAFLHHSPIFSVFPRELWYVPSVVYYSLQLRCGLL